MVETLTTGIILRAFNTNKLCIFTRSLGKIFCFVKKSQLKNPLIAGCKLNMSLGKKHHDTLHIEYIDTLLYPDIQDTGELFWLHHMLELYYYYLPEHQTSLRDFDFLDYYLTLKKQTQTFLQHSCLQKLAVSHFLAQTGFYEQASLHRYAKIFEEVIDPTNTSRVPFSQIGTEEVSIQNLILRCLQEHPQFHKFKTIPFLYGGRTL
ncbi:hypothetical protein FJ364_02565 [Candidatus Dependentiae bacterium]|nr:hypothetical protein [Candidatus Dependentiae bacterium]